MGITRENSHVFNAKQFESACAEEIPDRKDVAGYVDELSHHATDSAWLEGYAAACPLPGLQPVDYAPRRIRLSPDCTVIAGIHFRGTEVSFPFIDVSLRSGPLPESLEPLVNEFVPFRPRAIRIWWRSGEERRPGGEEDLVILVGSLTDLRRHSLLPESERIELIADPEVISYGEYQALYRDLFASDPLCREFVGVEEKSSLQQCADLDAYFRVRIDGEPAGFIAARPESYRVWRGWVMIEEVLHPRFRGKGLAPAMQQQLIHRLDPERGQLLLGTIDAGNLPSRRTAERVGRRVVETGTFYPPADLPV